MSDFAGMEELLSDFLLEAGEMLSEVDSMLLELEKHPSDSDSLNEIFRGFHTIRGGAGFLNATELVSLCHITENLFDKLRNNELKLTAEIMDVILATTDEVRRMFDSLQQGVQPKAASSQIMEDLKAVLSGKAIASLAKNLAKNPAKNQTYNYSLVAPATPSSSALDNVDWHELYNALTGTDIVDRVGVTRDPEKIAEAILEEESTQAVFGRRASDVPGNTVGRRDGDVPPPSSVTKETSIRVDMARLDQVLNLSSEIVLTKNSLTNLRSDIIQGRHDADTVHDLDQAVSQLDKLAVNLQKAVIKTRLQPIGSLFKKYPRLVGDLAHSLGKDVELVLVGEETEMDKTMIEDLNDPLVHLLRNAVDHGAETSEERIAAGKPEKSMVELSARQEGDHIIISISDDGRGMRPEAIRSKAIEQGLITARMANTLNESQCLELIFLPGFTTKDEISGVSGRGIGMDVVKTKINKLNGIVGIRSEFGKGTVMTIKLPLTLAIQPVSILRLGEQSFAVPQSMVREILSVSAEQLQPVSGRATMVVRGEVLPVLPLAQLIGWKNSGTPNVGVLMQFGNNSFILSADSFAGHDDVVIKSLDTFRPKGVAGVTMSRVGDIVLILDIRELLSDMQGR